MEFVFECKGLYAFREIGRVNKLENVFSYFVAIGSGLTFGIAIVAIPGILLIRKWTKDGARNVRSK